MAAVFRDYDQAALDRQYNNRARVPDFGALHNGWIARSRAVGARVPAKTSIAYGSDPRQCVDLWPASNRPVKGAVPCLAFIHGGYWQALAKDDCAYIVEPFVVAGIAVAMIEYRLCPHVTMCELFEDVRRAFAKLHAVAAQHDVDGSRIVVAGHSAGGHLATMLMTEDLAVLGLADDAIKGVVSISGLYDLEPIRLSFLNAALRMNAAEARALSPILRAPQSKAPLVLTLGADEPEEYQRQQSEFACAWRKHGLEPRIVPGPGDHFDALDALADPDGRLFAATMAMLR